MDPLAYYATQSPITDPGEHARLFADLPSTVDGRCRVVHGVTIHYMEGGVHGYEIPEERLPEINTRHREPNDH